MGWRGLVGALMLGACAPAAGSVPDELAFENFVFRQPAATSICRWSRTSPSSAVIEISGLQGPEVFGCDQSGHTYSIQLLGDLPEEPALLGPIIPDDLEAGFGVQALQLGEASSIERYAVAWLGRAAEGRNASWAAPMSSARPAAWYSCEGLCGIAFDYRGVAVRVQWNGEALGRDVETVARRTLQFLDAHTEPTGNP